MTVEVRGNSVNFILLRCFDHHLNGVLIGKFYLKTGLICQRDEMFETQDPPQPLPQRPHGQPRLGAQLRGPGEREESYLACVQ